MIFVQPPMNYVHIFRLDALCKRQERGNAYPAGDEDLPGLIAYREAFAERAR